MKKLVTIFLMALYAMSASASVVSIRSCGTMQSKVVISALENSDCCCADGPGRGSRQGMAKSIVAATPAHNGSAALSEQANAITPTPCCSEIVLQSRLASNQLINSETISVLDRASQLLPATLPDYITCRPALLKAHKPTLLSMKALPSAIPLYKLFQRFTLYG